MDDFEYVCVQLFIAVEDDGAECIGVAEWEGEKPREKPDGWVRWLGDAYEVRLSRGRDDSDTLQ